MSFKSTLINHLKNIPGYKGTNKLLVFSVDDFGNVRVGSRKALLDLEKKGMKANSIFDIFDTLESREDLEALFETLTTVKDIDGNHPVFTPFALPCNLNFEKMQDDGNERFINELLPETYRKLEAISPGIYSGSWEMWKEGISRNLLKPQFHGREHLNINTIQTRLNNKDAELIKALDNRSLCRLTKKENESDYTIAFAYQNFAENQALSEVIVDGLNEFEKVYGYRSSCFMAPSATISPIHHQVLFENGIRSIDTYVYRNQEYSESKKRKEFRWLGKQVEKNPMIFMVRNAVFEPIHETKALEKCKQMIDAAFRMGKPAIISSHRVNFVGQIDVSKRTYALLELKKLLKWLLEKYPDVRFISLDILESYLRKESGLSDF